MTEPRYQMTCPYLEYRREADGRSFAEPRAYCTAADRFIQPLRADVCNDRCDLEHAEHCEIYRAATEAEAEQEEEGVADAPADDGDDE